MSRWRLDWPTAGGGRPGRAMLKARPGDFRVDERLTIPGYQGGDDPLAVTGAGEHLFLRLEKTGDNTEYVARQLADLAGCRSVEVGFAGLKDRHAVTRQWFSLQRPGQEAEDRELLAGIARQWPVSGAHRCRHKLRRGDHQGNHFRIILTAVSGDRKRIDERLRGLADHGCPNYFGGQRFGHQGSNLDQALKLDPRSGPRRRRGRGRGRGPDHSGMYFSAARSWLFNEVLATRVEQGCWRSALPGEPVAGGVTGPLWGDGGTLATDLQEELERSVVGRHPDMLAVFGSTRMAPERRDLVLKPAGFQYQWLAEDRLELDFFLGAGQYATSVLQNVFELEDDGGQASGNSQT